MNQPKLARGELPVDAQTLLRMAGSVGTSGSMARASAIQKAERIIEERYPQYLRKD